MGGKDIAVKRADETPPALSWLPFPILLGRNSGIDPVLLFNWMVPVPGALL